MSSALRPLHRQGRCGRSGSRRYYPQAQTNDPHSPTGMTARPGSANRQRTVRQRARRGFSPSRGGAAEAEASGMTRKRRPTTPTHRQGDADRRWAPAARAAGGATCTTPRGESATAGGRWLTSGRAGRLRGASPPGRRRTRPARTDTLGRSEAWAPIGARTRRPTPSRGEGEKGVIQIMAPICPCPGRDSATAGGADG